MALFNKKTPAKAESKEKKETKPKETAVVAEVVTAETKAPRSGKGLTLEQVLVNPHVTEKATDLSEKGVYAFNVNRLANKSQIAQAIEKYFKVRPAKIAVVVTKAKYARNPRTNRVQVKRAESKKALVYLKKGDKIEFV